MGEGESSGGLGRVVAHRGRSRRGHPGVLGSPLQARRGLVCCSKDPSSGLFRPVSPGQLGALGVPGALQGLWLSSVVPARVASDCGRAWVTCLRVQDSILGQFDLGIWKVADGGGREGGCPQPVAETEVICRPPHSHPALAGRMQSRASLLYTVS